MKTVSVVIPAKNEEETLGSVLDGISSDIARLPEYIFEIIVVADHCTDGTEAVALEKNVRVILNERNPGKGNALISGFGQINGEIVIMLDSDGSHSSVDFGKMLSELDKGSHLVIGSRIKGGSDEYESWRLFGNALFTLMVNFLFCIELTDALNGYKAMKAEVVSQYRHKSPGFEIEIELLYSTLIRGYKVSEVPSHELRRMGGKMKSNTLIDGARFLMAILKWGLKYRINKFLKRRLR